MALRDVAVVFAVLGPPACTGESSFPLPEFDSGAPDARYEGACASWAKTECAYQGRCPSSIRGRWENDAQCVERETLQCELEAADPDVHFDAMAVAACVYPTDCDARTPGLCLSPGAASDGAACQWNDACASGACVLSFVEGARASCGVCVTPLSCSIMCEGGETCETEVDGGERCVTIPTVPTASLGEPCGSGAAGPVCFEDQVELYCDETQHCRAYLPAGYGQPCGETDAGATYLCDAFGSCASLDTVLCVAPAADGALCDDAQGLNCLPPARCQANHCAFPNLSWCASP